MGKSTNRWRSFEEAREYVRGLGLKSVAEWKEWCKSDQRPEDIPANPNVVYKDEWRGMRDWLDNRWRSFEEAREYVRGLRLKGAVEWQEWCKSGQRPEDIPRAPESTYKDQWRGMRDWLGTEWRSFEEAREFVRGLGLKTKEEWQEWCKSGQRPMDIPRTPQGIYKDQWRGMVDWLGYDGRKDPWRSRRRSFEEAREFVRALGLKNQREWRQYCRSGQRPSDIPAAPPEAYKDEWRDWGDWLGYEFRNSEWRSFEEAREYMRGLGLKGNSEWKEWCKSGQRPQDIPANPSVVYKGEYRGMSDWLGYDPINNRWCSFEEAREYARGLRLKGLVEWQEWCKSGQRPEDIPSHPDRSYQKEWRDWPDWLGTVNRWDRSTLLALLEDLRPRLPYLEERELYAILQQGGVMPKLRKAFDKTSPLKVLKDLKENEGRGIEEALREASGTEDEVPEEDVLEDDLPEDEILKAAEELKDEHAFEEDTILDSSEGLPTLGLKESLHAVDELAGLSYGLDDEVAEYLVSNRVAGLWIHYINDGQGAVREALEGEGGHYFGLIRTRFYEELEGVESLEVPTEWSFAVDGKAAPPNVMQRHTAWEVLTKKRVGNWSGPGAGKTLSGVLASRVVGCTNTLILTNNATVAGWCRQIRDAFPDSLVRTGPAYPVASRFNYTVLNYEKFQLRDRAVLVRQLAGLGIDFVILDEVQLVKQRDHKASMRRKAIEALVSELAERNSDLRVLGMSATPVINNLQEARKLLEVVTGHKHSELDTMPTINNALAVHRSLMVNGFRYRPRYELEIRTETVEVTRNDFLPDLLGARGVLGLEQALLPAKLDAALSYVRRGTVLYTHFVDGIVGPIRQYLEDRGFRVGLYTGPDKSGLEPFLSGNVDVLIGSKPVGTGLDGLQAVCDRMIMVSLPWTGAEYEQTVGRIRRQGSAFGSVSVIVPQVVLEYEGDVWSWDKGRMAAIEYKRTLSDCAVDGRIPETVRISEKELLEQSREALERWIERVGKEGVLVIEREKLTVPLPFDVREKLMVRRGDFSTINNRWSTSNSETVHERLKADPSEWYLYHTLYREAREGWSELPAQHIASHLRDRTDLKVGDFGCGECLLKEALPGHEVVGLDHVAVDESVIACDMAHAPLEDRSLGAVVFSLSLMGYNWSKYLEEAYRVLVPYGLLFVAEPVRRWKESVLERAITEHRFNLMFSHQREDFRYVGAVKGN